MLRACLRAAMVLAMAAATLTDGHAQPGPNGRPTRPPGWEYLPSPGHHSPAFAYDPCPGCWNTSTAPLTIRCEVGRSPTMTLQPMDQGGRLSALVNQAADIALIVDGARHAFRMPVEIGPDGPILEAAIPSEHPIFQALADGSRLVIASPGGAINIPLTRSGQVIRRWADACNAQVAAPVPGPAAPPLAGPAPASPAIATPLSGKGADASAAPPPARAPVVPTADRRRVVSDFLRRTYDGIRLQATTTVFADLNGDGIDEAMVVFDPESGQCGAANCPLEILDLSGPAVRQLFFDVIQDDGVRILDSRTGGWRDIRISRCVTLRWRGTRYGF